MRIVRIVFLALGAILTLGILGLAGCAAVKLPNVPAKPIVQQALPVALDGFLTDPPITTSADWGTRRVPLLAKAFADNVYGAMPVMGPGLKVKTTVIADTAFNGLARIEEWLVQIGGAESPHKFNLVVIMPRDAAKPAPVIVMQNFCGNHAALREFANVSRPLTPVFDGCDGKIAQNVVVPLIFGRHANRPPYEKILKRGYALAMVYAGDVVGDLASPETDATLVALTPVGTPDAQRTGALAVWARVYSWSLDVLAADSRIDAQKVSVWGHSRNGKSALLASATDPRIAGVIALQPGTAGAALDRDDKGEPIAKIIESYPYWFAPAFSRFAGKQSDLPIDQHLLIAMSAPRPILIGAGRRDAWADPQGMYGALQAASPVYQLFGAKAFAPKGMRHPDFTSPLVFYMRPGLHGVHSEDWSVALDFLDARVKGAATP